MGREFVSAAARWCHLTEMSVRPEIVAICNRTLAPEKIDWYTQNVPTIRQVTGSYQELLNNEEVEAVYVAVPHNLHEPIYCEALKAGKHLLGEKPFGIDLTANEAILKSMAAHPQLLVRCASQYIFFPAVRHMLQMIENNAFGRIIEVNSGFLHSSDLNPEKPINWKRMIDTNGEYGVMGDLGTHIALVTFRAGWEVHNTRAICSNIVSQRPDASGNKVPCETWDNVSLLSECYDPQTSTLFPWNLKVDRIMPGESNSWYLEIYGTQACARFSLKNPKQLELLHYRGGEQHWQRVDMGFETAYPTITGKIFEFGALDAFMQLMASFMYELESKGKPLNMAAACPSPQETNACHRLFTAAIQSQNKQETVKLYNI